MNVLILGSGGREHAIGWAVSQSEAIGALYFAPGNAGTSALGLNISMSILDGPELVSFCLSNEIDLVIVGPEQPLVAGIADILRDAGLAVVGPSAKAAQLEGSKSFAKDFMRRHNIPTASYRTFSGDQLADALSFVEEEGAPIVVKASGLAGGKGAIVCETIDEARRAVNDLMRDKTLGEAGDEVVIESFMHGEEASLFAISDGSNYVLLATAQDHKQVGDGDIGPNTGGMGAYAPAPLMTPALLERACKEVVEPTLSGMASEGMPYSGILYCGLMVTTDGPQVVEYNCRLGDPETQVVLPLMASDALEMFHACATGTIDGYEMKTKPGSAACVVMASSGYPGSYEIGKPIAGIDAAQMGDFTTVFQAGTTDADEGLLTAGGRVLAVSATGETLLDAVNSAYVGCSRINFEGAFYRTDIGKKGLARSVSS